MRLAALIGYVLLWFLNSVILKRIFDVSDYEQFKAFWKTRGILYDGLFLCMALAFFFPIKYWKLERAISCFMIIVTAGSLIDKAFIGKADYMYSDIVLIVLGVIVSVIVYGRDQRRASSVSN